tara:strand:+ start:189 stop:539 length:351 start_codon:yes stop_codon:yes gene_type:complete
MTKNEENISRCKDLLSKIRGLEDELDAETIAWVILKKARKIKQPELMLRVVAHVANFCNVLLEKTLGSEAAERELNRARDFHLLYTEYSELKAIVERTKHGNQIVYLHADKNKDES